MSRYSSGKNIFPMGKWGYAEFSRDYDRDKKARQKLAQQKFENMTAEERAKYSKEMKENEGVCFMLTVIVAILIFILMF